MLNSIVQILEKLGLSAQKRAMHIQFSNTALNEEIFIQRIDGEHVLNQGVQATLICLSTNAFIPLKQFIGVQVAIDQVTDQGELFRTTGIITEATQGQSDGSLTLYKLSLEDATSLWHKRRNSRVFMNKSVREVSETIFKEWQSKSPLFAASLTLDLSGLSQNYDVRPFIMQSNESDYDFLTRLWRSEGINWLIDEAQLKVMHSSSPIEKQKLRLIDDNSQYQALSRRNIRFHRSSATEKQDSITSLIGERSIQPTAVHVQRWQADGLSQEEGAGSVQSKHQHSQNQDNASLSLEQAWHVSPAWMQDLNGEDQATAASNSQIEKLNQNLTRYHELQSKKFNAQSTVRDTQVGYWFELNEHPEIDQHSGADKEFLITEKKFYNQNNLPKDLTEQVNQLIAQSQWKIKPIQEQAERQANNLILQRRNISTVPEYNPLEHRPSTHPQRAKVVGPSGEEIHVDEWGRIKVRFLFTRGDDHSHDGGAGSNDNDTDSAWVDVLTPWAGEGYGARFLPRINEIVVIDFFDGNIDRPFVVGRIHEAQRRPTQFDSKGNLPDTKKLAGIKSKEVQGEGFGQLRFDDSTGQISTQLQSTHGATQLNLGNLSHPKETAESEGRGEGFELRTDQWGAVRAGQGLLVSTHRQQQAAMHLDAQAAKDQIEANLNSSKALSEVAKNQQTDPLEVLDNLKNFLGQIEKGSKEKADAFKQALMILSAPNSIAVSSQEDIHLSADGQISQSAGDSINLSSQKSLIAHAQSKISLFAAQEGLRAYAGKGKVEIQAQGDGADLIARKGIQIISTEDQIEIKASKKIVLTAGGSQIEISSAGVLPTTAGKFEVKAGQHKFVGGNRIPTLNVNLPALKIKENSVSECPIRLKQSNSNTEYISNAESFTALNDSALHGHSCSSLLQPISIVDYLPEPLSGKIVETDQSGNLISIGIEKNETLEDGYVDYYENSKRYKVKFYDYSEISQPFDIRFDPLKNLLTVTTKISFKGKKRVLVDNNNQIVTNKSGIEVELPYDSSLDLQNSMFSFEDIEIPYKDWFDFNKAKSEIEKILNKNNFYLYPKNCAQSKCTCKVPVWLEVVEAQDGHEVNIYKLSTRADSSNWSINATAEYEASKKQVTDYYQIYEFIENSTSLTDFQQYDFECWKFEPIWMSNNIHAHESGHLFNWPDEYFSYGGAVNQRYTLATSNPPYQIDLKMTEPADFWKRNSKNNLMGEGTLIKNPQMHEYYLHQIRDWFEKETGINWDVKS